MGSCFSGHNDEVIEQKPLESTAKVTHDQKVAPLCSVSFDFWFMDVAINTCCTDLLQ